MLSSSSMNKDQKLIVRYKGLVDYEATWIQMKEFTGERGPQTPDEIWLLEHPPVYTLGQAGKEEHILNPAGINIVRSDRGGQVTYHGPGQLVAYLLLDVSRKSMGVRQLVNSVENAIILFLQGCDLKGERVKSAPGVYIDGKKIAALGLRIRRGCCYHGLSLNVDMDLTPYAGINPCGYDSLEVTQLKDCGVTLSLEETGQKLIEILSREFSFRELEYARD